jgi:hypothetical protein
MIHPLPFDIIVPSKGRPDGTTFGLLSRSRLPFIIVVENTEVDLYQRAHPHATIWTLPHANKGIGYSRAYIMQRASKPYVMIDDDITQVFRRQPNISTLQSISLRSFLKKGWKYLSHTTQNLGMVGYKHGSFAIPAAKTSITTIAHIVFVNPHVLRQHQVYYDSSLRAFEDIDILFKCARNGVRFVRYNELMYFTTPSGTSTQGGINYKNNLKEKHLDRMVKRYPGWIAKDNTTRVSDGQPIYHIDWITIRKYMVKHT